MLCCRHRTWHYGNRQRAWKVRPMAMASPTDFIWVVSSALEPGNFSNANRGICGSVSAAINRSVRHVKYSRASSVLAAYF